MMVCETYMKYPLDIRILMNLKGVGILLAYILQRPKKKKNQKVIYDSQSYVSFSNLNHAEAKKIQPNFVLLLKLYISF